MIPAAGFLALVLFVYLVAALLKPEWLPVTSRQLRM